MIQKEKIQRGRIDDEFIKLSITGKVEDILQHKVQINLENIFECDMKRKLVLIEGAPGSGKSTLALHICQEWAVGRLFQQYSAVILVRLRDPLIREAKTVADLLPCVNKAMAEETEAALVSVYGEGVLWVLDGWDELPSDLPLDSIINKLIQPEIFQESPLLQSSVIVTSRPSSSAELHPLVSSRVEVLGFTPLEIEQFFRECLEGSDSGAVQTLLERIRENPVVEGSCYLPLNAAIVAHIFLSGDHTLPTSNHGIFTAVVQSSLKRYLQDKLGKTTPVGDITALDSLSPVIRTHVSNLCQLAFHGTQNNKLIFSDSDLIDLSISKDISEIGLLQSVPSIVSDGHKTFYCFLHLSIQELLSAVHISHMSPKQQISVFQELFGTQWFSAVFQFYAGITKLKTSRPWLKKLPRFLCPVPVSGYDLVRIVVKKEVNNYFSKPLLVSLLHCLNEAEDPSLCVFLAEVLDHSLNLINTTLSPLDCLSVGYFLSVVSTTVSGEFEVDLRRCSIGDQGCKFLVRGLCKCLNSGSISTSHLTVMLWSNNIHEEGIYHIAHLLNNTNVIRNLGLSYNPIGVNGLNSLCKALSTNTTLEVLFLGWCLLTLSEEQGLPLHQLLSRNSSLRHLSLRGNEITDCGHIAVGLSNNNSLRRLDLHKCSLTDRCVEDLSAGLNNYIEEMDISGNYSITENGLRTLTRHLSDLSRLSYLNIPYHLGSCIDTVFSEVNEERRRNGLPTIEVTGECYSLWLFLALHA